MNKSLKLLTTLEERLSKGSCSKEEVLDILVMLPDVFKTKTKNDFEKVYIEEIQKYKKISNKVTYLSNYFLTKEIENKILMNCLKLSSKDLSYLENDIISFLLKTSYR